MLLCSLNLKCSIGYILQFNASDVLKEVTVYEAVDKEAQYCYKVRRLSEFCRTKVVWYPYPTHFRLSNHI